MGVFRKAYWDSAQAGLGLPRQYVRSGPYRTYTPSPLMGQPLDSISPRSAAGLSEAERLIASLESSLATRAGAGEAPLAMLRFLEGVGSSAMEGYRSAAARLVASVSTGGVGAKGSDLKIMGNLDALDRALSLADARAIGIGDMVAMQGDLLNERGESSLVGVREEQNWVGGSDHHPLDAAHVPPPPEDVGWLMDDLCGFVSAPSHTPPLLRAALAHAQFETIHPFVDGNGRTGRAMVHLMLRRDKLTDRTVLPLSGTWGKDRARYIDYLNRLRTEGDRWSRDTLDEVAQFIADTATEAALSAFSIAGAVQSVEEQLRDRVATTFRADSVAHHIVRDACINLGVTADAVAARHGVSAAAATRALDRMEETGALKRRSVQRPHVFYVPEMVALIERFAAQIPDAQGAGSADVDALVAVASRRTGVSPPTGRDRCGAWMPRSRAHCALPQGHPGWPTSGHRQG